MDSLTGMLYVLVRDLLGKPGGPFATQHTHIYIQLRRTGVPYMLWAHSRLGTHHGLRYPLPFQVHDARHAARRETLRICENLTPILPLLDERRVTP